MKATKLQKVNVVPRVNKGLNSLIGEDIEKDDQNYEEGQNKHLVGNGEILGDVEHLQDGVSHGQLTNDVRHRVASKLGDKQEDVSEHV